MRALTFLLALFLFFSGCSYKQIKYVHVEKKEVKKHKDLVTRYMQYWDYFSKKDFENAYKYELPHQRFLYSLSWYKKFNEPNDANYTIVLQQIRFLNPFSAIVRSKYISSDKQTSFIFDDKWFKIGSHWYHEMKTSKLPDFQFLP